MTSHMPHYLALPKYPFQSKSGAKRLKTEALRIPSDPCAKPDEERVPGVSLLTGPVGVSGAHFARDIGCTLRRHFIILTIKY